MWLRMLFPSIALFWIVMNVLLWRAEFGSGRETGSAVSADVVWQKILTAPDDSTLEINWNGRRLGYCRWVPHVGDERVGAGVLTDEFQPEGRVKRPAGYNIEVEGNLLVGQPAARLRFNSRLRLANDSRWQEFTARLALRPALWELRAEAASEKLTLKYEEDGDKWSRTFAFDELRQPEKLIAELGGPLALALMAPLQGIAPLDKPRELTLGLEWEARNDSLKIGHSNVRVYRLQARLLAGYQITVLVSRVGELMRVELPNGIVLVNESLLHL